MNKSKNSNSHYLQDLYHELSLDLGDAVWAFARIEWIAYEYICKFYPEGVETLLEEIDFCSRINILKKYIKSQSLNSDIKKEANSALNKAIKLAEKRNIIVHNPWRIWVDLDAKDFMTEIQTYSNREKKVNLKEIKKFISDVEVLEKRLKSVLNAL